MPVETKKVLWTVISVGLFLVVFFGTALLLFAPRKGSPQAPAAVGNEAPPRVNEPDEYLRNPAPAPVPVPAPTASGEVVVVYGDNPPAAALPGAPSPLGTPATTPSGTLTPSPSAPAGAALPVPAKSGMYTPASSTPPAKAPSAAKAPAPAPKPKTVTVSEWWIQASSPTSRSHAESLQAELARQGLSSVITLKDVDGTTHYRVRIGPYTTEKEAAGWRDRVRALPDCAEAYVSKTTVQRTM